MEEEAASWRTGIDAVSQAAEIYSSRLQLRNKRESLFTFILK